MLFTPPKKKKNTGRTILLIILILIMIGLLGFGVYIILRDQTPVFNQNSAEIPDVTFPPVPDNIKPTPWPTELAETPDITGTVDPNLTPGSSNTPETTPSPTTSETEPSTTMGPIPTVSGELSKPVSIYFVEYGVSVKIQPVGVKSTGEMETVPRYDIAGWFKYGAYPSETGNCVIAGHNRYHGQLGLFAVVKDDLKPGDRIILTLENGEHLFYVVDSINQYRYDQLPYHVVGASEDRRLTLITCLGDYSHTIHHSRTRVVAVCYPIN